MKNNFVLSKSLSEIDGSDSITEPVILQEAKKALRISDTETADDDLISELITTARQQIENYLNTSLIERTVTATLLNELGGIWLPYAPVNVIVSVYRMDEDAAFEETEDNILTSDDYYTHGRNFKQLYTGDNCRVQVTYSAGYVRLPVVFKNFILRQVAWLYDNRGDATKNDLSPELLASMRAYRRVV